MILCGILFPFVRLEVPWLWNSARRSTGLTRLPRSTPRWRGRDRQACARRGSTSAGTYWAVRSACRSGPYQSEGTTRSAPAPRSPRRCRRRAPRRRERRHHLQFGGRHASHTALESPRPDTATRRCETEGRCSATSEGDRRPHTSSCSPAGALVKDTRGRVIGLLRAMRHHVSRGRSSFRSSVSAGRAASASRGWGNATSSSLARGGDP